MIHYPITAGSYRIVAPNRPVLVGSGYKLGDSYLTPVTIWRCTDLVTGDDIEVHEGEFLADRPNEMEVIAWATLCE